MNRPMPDHISDGPADNWPGDQTDQDWQEERDRKRQAMTRDIIRELIADALDDEFIDLVSRLVVKQDRQTACEHLTVGKAFNERTAAEIERYLEES